jgi:mxaA protein
MRFKIIFLLIVWLLSSCSSSINEPITHFQVQTPRPFGYVIGDEIKQRIIIEARKGLALQYSSIPSKGAMNRWLNLNKIKVDKSNTRKGIRYQIDLTYQLFYAPLEVKMLELPNFTLQFRQFSNTVEKTVPRWYFTSAPLRELAIRKDDGKEYMRADTHAPLLDSDPSLNRLRVSLFMACLLAVYLAWLYGLLSFLPKYQIFKRPVRKLAKSSENDLASMLKIMHKALNSLNGKPLFKHQLNDFYQRFPNYQQLHSELIWFFNYSNQHYFSAPSRSSKNENNKIKVLCQHCLQIERGKR